MKALRMLLKHPQILKLSGYEKIPGQPGQHLRQETRKEVLTLVKEAKFFLIDPVIMENIHKDDLDTDNLPMSPPFKTCWFEIGLVNGSWPLLGVLEGEEGKEISIAEVGILINELSPGLYDLFCFEAVINEKNEKGLYSTIISVFRGVSDDMADLQHKYTDGEIDSLVSPVANLKLWLSALQRGALGVEQTEEVVRVPRADKPSKKIPHAIRKIIRIVPRSGERPGPITQGGIVDWSHRWEVRGHWRKVDGLGKDREGNYFIQGHTWVKQHTKGPEHAPLITDKVRHIKGSIE